MKAFVAIMTVSVFVVGMLVYDVVTGLLPGV